MEGNTHDAFLTDLGFTTLVDSSFLDNDRTGSLQIVVFYLACIAHDTPVGGRFAASTNGQYPGGQMTRCMIDWG